MISKRFNPGTPIALIVPVKTSKRKLKSNSFTSCLLSHPLMVQFCDLSSDLDHRFSFVGKLVQNLDPDQPFEDGAELGYIIVEYLEKRAVLEHVFLGRYLNLSEYEAPHLKAEIWKLQKIKAKAVWATRSRN